MELPPFPVSPEDHDAGFKDLQVEDRAGRQLQLRVHALSRRVAEQKLVEWFNARDSWVVVQACLYPVPEVNPVNPVTHPDKLTLDSATLLEATALALCYGSSFQKKMLALAKQLTQPNPPPTAAPPNSPALALDSPAPKSAPGPAPSSPSGPATSKLPGCTTISSNPSPSGTPKKPANSTPN
jgi:hypothetical protein